jgi:amidase
VQPAVETALRDAARLLSDAGWEVVETEPPDFREPARLQANLWLAEFRRTGAAAVATEDDPDATFIYAQMVRHNQAPDLNGMLDTLQRRATLARGWQEFLADYPVLLCPNSAQLPFADLYDLESPETFDEVLEAMLPQIATPFVGLPGMNVATGMGADNVPVGVQLIGGRYREDTLFAAAEVIEAGYPAIRPVDPAS